MIDVVLLGSTGSIGRQAIEVCTAQPSVFRLVGLAAGGDAELLARQARDLAVPRVALAAPPAAERARALLPGVEVLEGAEGVAALAGHPADVVLNGIAGAVGLSSTLAALAAGTPVALANKESLIVGGELVTAAARAAEAAGAPSASGRSPALGGLWSDWLRPVDSEHSALAQCLRGADGSEVARLVLTASGGPFRGRSRADLAEVTVDEALAHPTWRMGSLITVNSATLANKGLEVIEAHHLFGIPFDRIEVVVHPQSVVHGLVEFHDGATLAKLSPPDMRLPIQLALGHPARLDQPVATMDWARELRLDFEPVDHGTFPLLSLSVAAGRAGGTAPAVLNAANEEAVGAFLRGATSFLGIAGLVEAVLEAHDPLPASGLDVVLAADHWARERTRALLGRG